MAHFAQLDENNTVIKVIVVANNVLLDNEIESEFKGVEFCKSLLGGYWKQTSYNAKFRKNFAGIGSTYNLALDAFIHPKPFSSWILNEETCKWVAPTNMPVDGNFYQWNETTLTWDEIINE